MILFFIEIRTKVSYMAKRYCVVLSEMLGYIIQLSYNVSYPTKG